MADKAKAAAKPAAAKPAAAKPATSAAAKPAGKKAAAKEAKPRAATPKHMAVGLTKGLKISKRKLTERPSAKKGVRARFLQEISFHGSSIYALAP